ncbi:MAG: sensor histidine kinase [Hyalangium sp.]|uniref:sensor histidine kinase n=1 Tax=Hyalangium sp. TaxID=2028555 RepID=UPI00389AE4E4
MLTSSVPGRTLARGLYAESPTPCLLFEATRDPEGNLLVFQFVAANPAAEARARLDEPDGGPARWAEELQGLLELADCARVLETGEPSITQLCVQSRGVETWWLSTAVRHGDGFALWLRDVTRERLEEREARQALEQAQAREERMEEEAEFRERFLGILGHDLRNPLNAISLSARAMAQYGSLTAMQQELGLRIEASAARMTKMIADILDLTRARRSDGIPLVLAPSSLSSVCCQVVEELAVAYPERQIAYDDEDSGWGMWDAERLAQVVSNLVGNALEHGGADVPVFVRSYARGELLALEVHNPGEPIPEPRLATLFEPFQPADTSGQRKRRRGLGLGLYIVRELVHAHGGRVAVHSAEGEGTTFTVLLPRDARQALAERSAPGEAHST